MFPTISRIPSCQAATLEYLNAFGDKVISSKGGANSDKKFSSNVAKDSAVNILYDVNTFIRSTQTDSRDVKVLRKFLRERWLYPSRICESCTFEQPSTKYAAKRTARIITDVDSFLTSRHTTREDGVTLRHLLNKNVFANSSSGIGSNVHDATHRTKKAGALNHQKSVPSTTYEKLVRNYDKVVEGLYDYQIKRITDRLAHNGTFSSGERLLIYSKPEGSERAWSLLDTLTMQSVRRPSLDKAALRFEAALQIVNSRIASDMFRD